MGHNKDIGALHLGEQRCCFRVWAPRAEQVSVLLPIMKRTERLEPEDKGYWSAVLEHVPPETGYYYLLDGKTRRPDPASHFQPEGVHGFSSVINHASFAWEDSAWSGRPLKEMVLYELHIGTFTPEGTFAAVIPRLEQLKDLGINTLSLMPVAQFPGPRNWGYDGVYPFAVQNSYGGPQGLKSLVNACHQKDVGVVLDVVYNHLGPEGNYLHDYGPYFTSKYKTPWGDAVNFDDAWSDEVRGYFIRNALHWLKRYHIDGLRLDAVHAITDMSARPFLKELAERVMEYNRCRKPPAFLIAESDLNDPEIIRPADKHGYGLDAQWCDDFHHALHALLTGEKAGYYCDFGSVSHLAESLREGYVLTGGYSVFRRRRHGASAADRPADQFVVFTQNHDQVGNRLRGDRLSALVPFPALKLAAGVMILSPYIPMLFMGEEYGEDSPFLYFVSHGDPDLVAAVREGRRNEFPEFFKDTLPDPQAESTFDMSRLNWALRHRGRHGLLLDVYRSLLQLRKESAACDCEYNDTWVRSCPDQQILIMLRGRGMNRMVVLMHFSNGNRRHQTAFPPGVWKKKWDSSEERWGGPGSKLPERIAAGEEIILPPWSLTVYKSEVKP